MSIAIKIQKAAQEDTLFHLLTKEEKLTAKQLSRISSAIQKERLDRKMSQEEFAKFMGVSQGMISKWENGEYNFSISSLTKICSKLGLQLSVNMRQPKPPLNFPVCYSWDVYENPGKNRIS